VSGKEMAWGNLVYQRFAPAARPPKT
jgi:hypothetical protein